MSKYHCSIITQGFKAEVFFLYDRHYMFGLTRKILDSYYQDECDIHLVYGMPEGIGKSAYAIKTFAEIKGRPYPWKGEQEWDMNFEAVKPLVLFYPSDVVGLCKRMIDKGKREEGFIWDDAGLWLNAMEWNDPFVIAFTKYLNIARTNWGSIVLTSPVPEWVLKKIRSSEGLIFTKITKVNNAKELRGRIRMAKTYRRWVHPDRKKTGVRLLFEQVFDATMPNPFYKEWYKPLRDSYARRAIELMFQVLNKRADKGWINPTDNTVLESVQEGIGKANDKSEDLQEAIQSVRA